MNIFRDDQTNEAGKNVGWFYSTQSMLPEGLLKWLLGGKNELLEWWYWWSFHSISVGLLTHSCAFSNCFKSTLWHQYGPCRYFAWQKGMNYNIVCSSKIMKIYLFHENNSFWLKIIFNYITAQPVGILSSTSFSTQR